MSRYDVVVIEQNYHTQSASGSSTWSRLKDNPWYIAIVAFVLSVLVIIVGHTYRITPRDNFFQFGWEAGRIARSIANGHGFANPTNLTTGPTAWEAPVFPYILASIFKIFGVYTRASAFVVFTLNSLFSALTCVTLYAIGKRLFNRTVARWTAWTWALLPYTIYWSVRIVWETALSTLLFTVVLLLTLRLDDRPRRRDWLLLGLTWGVIALTNPALGSFAPLSLIWLWWRLRKRLPATRNVALVCIIAVAVMTPWLVRNYTVFHRFIFIRDNFGLELQAANNPQSNGLWTRTEHPANDAHEMRKFAAMGELPYMEMKQREGIQFIREHPATFLQFAAKRLVYFWAANPQTTYVNGFTFVYARHTAFLISAAFAFAGFWLLLRNRVRAGWLFAAQFFVYPIPYLITFPSPRYRHAIEPAMLLLTLFMFSLLQGKEVRLPWTAAEPKEERVRKAA